MILIRDEDDKMRKSRTFFVEIPERDGGMTGGGGGREIFEKTMTENFLILRIEFKKRSPMNHRNLNNITLRYIIIKLKSQNKEKTSR